MNRFWSGCSVVPRRATSLPSWCSLLTRRLAEGAAAAPVPAPPTTSTTTTTTTAETKAPSTVPTDLPPSHSHPTQRGLETPSEALRMRIQAIRLRYCGRSGSSAGIREYLANRFVEYARRHPEVQFKVELRPQGHPVAIGVYANGYERVLDVKNMDVQEVAERVAYLRGMLGRPPRTPSQLSFGVISRHPSIQGMTRVAHWNVHTAERHDRLAMEHARKRYGVPSFGELVQELGMVRATRLYRDVEALARQREMRQRVRKNRWARMDAEREAAMQRGEEMEDQVAASW